jgi:hypothetical protein
MYLSVVATRFAKFASKSIRGSASCGDSALEGIELVLFLVFLDQFPPLGSVELGI